MLTINGDYLKLGSYKNIVTDYKVSTPIEFEFNLSDINHQMLLHTINRENRRRIRVNEISLKLKLKKYPSKVRVNNYSVFIKYDKEDTILIEIEYIKSQYIIKFNGKVYNQFKAEIEDIFHPYLLRATGKERSLVYNKIRREMQEYIWIATKLITRYFLSINYITAIREGPSRFYFDDNSNISSVGKTGQFTASSLYKLNRSKDTKVLNDRIVKWMKKFDLAERINIKEIEGEGIFKINLHNQNDLKLNITDVGLGTSQILPIVIESVMSDDGDINIFEQPEVHLQPKIQADLIDMFVAELRNGKNFIIETHSEHLINRLQSRVADGTLIVDDVGIYYISNNEGYTDILKLDLNAYGEISNWPHSFFEDDLEDAIYRMEQMIQRKRGE